LPNKKYLSLNWIDSIWCQHEDTLDLFDTGKPKQVSRRDESENPVAIRRQCVRSMDNSQAARGE